MTGILPQSVPQVKIIHQPMDGLNRFVQCRQNLNKSFIKNTQGLHDKIKICERRIMNAARSAKILTRSPL